MSLIDDVREEVGRLDLSVPSLRRFGFAVGGVFLLLALLLALAGAAPWLRNLLGAAGLLLAVSGGAAPQGLKGVYKVWMGAALAIGWVVSRILLAVLFFVVVTPTGLVTRALGKDFLGIRGERRESYWVKRDPRKRSQYEKMY